MSNEQEQQINPADADFRFLSLVMSLATAAWSQLGKVPHPSSNKIERDLQQAHMTIEFLRMLQEKTKGNLKPKEEELITHIVSDLEMNFADEAKKEESGAAGKAPDIIIPAGAKAPEIIKP